ncbi:MAG TPA: CBS domain-containing protein [Alphaproteobacteria bacterium]|nr:CBS domain-containing protein [Alphaproteobacteria bacterium]
MHVAQILKGKGSTVYSVTPETSVADAIRTLSKRRVGALLALRADGNVAGIVSERDIVHGLAEHGARLLEMRVAELMTRNVVSCAPEDTVEEIMRQMTNRRIRHLPVTDRGALAGMVSIGDVVKSRLAELAAESDALRSYIAGA